MRWERASSRVVLLVADSSARTKSSRIMDDRGVVQDTGDIMLWLSSIARDTAAAVNALVVLQVEKSASVDMGLFGKEAMP